MLALLGEESSNSAKFYFHLLVMSPWSLLEKSQVIRNLIDKEADDSSLNIVSQPSAKKSTRTPRRTNYQPTLSAEPEEILIPVNKSCCDEIEQLSVVSHSDSDTNAKQMDECSKKDENKNLRKIKEDDVLLETNRRLKNKVLSLQASQKMRKRELRNMKRKVSYLEELLQEDKNKERREIMYLDSDDNMKSDDEEESEMDQPYVMETDDISASEDEDDLEDEPEA
ncbi:Hypothetical predicted protein, partial [Paramuricea clavata]